MPSYLKLWDETNPAGGRDQALGDDDIRDFKAAFRERFATDHYALAIEGNDDKIGYHTKATLLKQANDPLAYAGSLILYSKLAGSFSELFCRHENSGIQRLTNLGKLFIDSLGTDGEVRGDVITRGSSGWGRYPLGPAGYVFRSDGTDSLWSTISANDIALINASALPVGAVINTDFYATAAYALGANATPWPGLNTTPTNAQGDQFFSRAYTPLLSTSKLRITVIFNCGWASSRTGSFWVCQDSIVNALAVGNAVSDVTVAGTGSIKFEMTPGSTNQITFKVRAGQTNAGYVCYFNGSAAAGPGQVGNGVEYSSILIEEIKQ